MNRELELKSEAMILKLQTEKFERLLNEYLTSVAISTIEKVELTEWLDKEGLGGYVC